MDEEFTAKLSRTKTLLTFLKSIHFRDEANFFVGSNGMKVTVEDSKSFQANAFVQRELFHTFSLPHNPNSTFSFRLSLSILLECLHIFNKTAQLQLSYSLITNKLSLHIEEEGAITEAVIRTQESEETLDFSFGKDEVRVKMIIVSEYIKEVFNELDTSSEFVTFSICPSESVFRISTFGSCGGKNYVDIPAESDVMTYFSAKQRTVAKFKHSLLRHGLKPISMSEKISIRLDERNFICLQYMVKVDHEVSFLEFYCAPEEDEE